MDLTNEFLYDEKAQSALNTICKRPFDSKTAYKIGKIKSTCQKQGKEFFPKFVDLIVKYAYHNEDGSLRRDNGPDSFTIKPEHKVAWDKESKALLAESFFIKTDKIPLAVFETIEPEILQALLPILEVED